MVDPPHSDGTRDEPDPRYDRESTTGIPRWVKVVGIVAAIVALLVIVMMLIGGGGHSPLRHVGDGANTLPVKVTLST